MSRDFLLGTVDLGVETTGEIGAFRSAGDLGPWHVPGGSFDGMSSLADGTSGALIPPPDERV